MKENKSEPEPCQQGTVHSYFDFKCNKMVDELLAENNNNVARLWAGMSEN